MAIEYLFDLELLSQLPLGDLIGPWCRFDNPFGQQGRVAPPTPLDHAVWWIADLWPISAGMMAYVSLGRDRIHHIGLLLWPIAFLLHGSLHQMGIWYPLGTSDHELAWAREALPIYRSIAWMAIVVLCYAVVVHGLASLHTAGHRRAFNLAILLGLTPILWNALVLPFTMYVFILNIL